MLQSIGGAEYPRVASSAEKRRNVYGGNLPLLRQFATDWSEHAPLGDTSAANRAASVVPPTASTTSEAVVSFTTVSERITMSTENIHGAFITQDVASRLWNRLPDFETMGTMATKAESPESTQEVARRLKLTREAFGMKKAAWCRFVGISPQAWQNVEGGENTPAINRISIDEALKVCRATGVGLNWIYRGDRDDVPIKVALELQKLDPPPKKKPSAKRA